MQHDYNISYSRTPAPPGVQGEPLTAWRSSNISKAERLESRKIRARQNWLASLISLNFPSNSGTCILANNMCIPTTAARFRDTVDGIGILFEKHTVVCFRQEHANYSLRLCSLVRLGPADIRRNQLEELLFERGKITRLGTRTEFVRALESGRCTWLARFL